MKEPNPLPPKLLLRFFRWFCHPELHPYIEGDLMELYEERIKESGKRKADRRFIIDILLLFRPSMIRPDLFRPSDEFNLVNQYAMLKNYSKVGLRNILKYKVFSLINVFGLAVAMSVCMLIILMLADQMSYDQFNENKDRIYRILSDEDNSKAPNAVTAFPLANTLMSDYSVIGASTHLIRGIGGDARYEDKSMELHGYFADASFFKVFSFDLKEGNKNSALVAPNSMVISSEKAHQLFGDEDPIGKTVEWSDRGLLNVGGGAGTTPMNWGLYTITGVIADKNYKSHLQFDVLVSSSSIPSLIQSEKLSDFINNWQNSQSYTYVLLIPEKNSQDLNASLHGLVSHHYVGPDVPKGFTLFGQKLSEITPGIVVRNEPSQSLPKLAYYFLGLLALVIMLSACLNYTNLSVARALTRAKEIGVRKVTGAFRKDLIYQFLSESMIMAVLALVLAFVLLLLVKSAFMGLWINQYLNFDLQENPTVYGIFVAFALLIGLIAGIYPAFYLSKFQPIKALKNLESMRTGKLGLRKVLSISQFVISLFFITTSILIYNQFRYFLAFKYEFNSSNIANISLQGNDYQKIANELNTVPGVAAISASDIIPATSEDNGIMIKPSGSDEEYKMFNILHTDEHFLDNLELKIIARKNLIAGNETSERYILVNEAAVKTLGYQNPTEILGQVLDQEYREPLEVIGVVQDFRFKMLLNEDKIGPLVIQNRPDAFRYANVKIASHNLMETVAAMEKKWNQIDPVHAFNYQFYDDQLTAEYQVIFDLVSILGFIAFMAINIACLGMLGMATFAAERKTKEVGIRKVLGAENYSIALLLSKEFLTILAISILIAAPLSYFFNNFWLQFIPNRVDFGWSTLLIGSIILLVLGLVTIGSQTIRAARRNPIETIRME